MSNLPKSATYTVLVTVAVLFSLPVAIWAAVTFGLGHARLFPYRLEALNYLLFVVLLVGVPSLVGLCVHRALWSLTPRTTQATAQLSRRDVLRAVDQQFAANQCSEALRLLDQYGTVSHERERERVQMAIVALSKGDLAAVADLVQAAKQDYRDVLYWTTNNSSS